MLLYILYTQLRAREYKKIFFSKQIFLFQIASTLAQFEKVKEYSFDLLELSFYNNLPHPIIGRRADDSEAARIYMLALSLSCDCAFKKRRLFIDTC